MKVYLDNCALQRPLDDKSQMRIRLEAEAILSILSLVRAGEIILISSEALTLEVRKNRLATRRNYAASTLELATFHVAVDDRVEHRAREFIRLGIQPLDALHLALAEKADVDYFCTCDDRFLSKAKHVSDLGIAPVTPLELIEELDL